MHWHNRCLYVIEIDKGGRSMKKMLIALGMVAIFFLTVNYVAAQGPPGPPMPPGPRGMPRQGPFLGPEQQVKIQELRQKFSEESAQLRGSLLTKRLELQSLWTNPEADPNIILEKERELRDLQNQMGEKILQYKLETRKLLTPEQISQFGRIFGMAPVYGRGPMMDYDMGMHPRGPGMGMWP
jgi:Spy/CpxP family protein refolding chaperone